MKKPRHNLIIGRTHWAQVYRAPDDDDPKWPDPDGQCDAEKREIVLHPRLHRRVADRTQVFMHESLHGIDFVYSLGLEELGGEALINRTATALRDFCDDNGIDFIDSYVSKIKRQEKTIAQLRARLKKEEQS